MWEIELHQLDIFRLTSTHISGSGTELLDRGWTSSFSGVTQGERRRLGTEILMFP